LSSELDPDANLYLRDIGHSRYYVEDEFNSMITKETQHISIFSIFHLNIRSLIQNLTHLTDFLNNIDMQFSIIGITETWLKESSHLVDIDGYTFIHNHRNNRRGGGTGLYISNNFQFKLRPDLTFVDDTTAETTFIEIIKPRGNTIVGVVYRAPDHNIDVFLKNYNELLGKITNLGYL
jgi:hypothetical protein